MPMLLVFALTLFASAMLLFLVEPMIGKMILPLLGGTPAVWNTCMVFFQAILLLGYGYAHLSTSWLGSRKQAGLHLLLLLAPFTVLPLVIDRGFIKGDENPIVLVLMILSLSVGLPMFVVSASAPLLQKWFASTSHPAAKDPYFLYGASNLGSMLALIAYPVVVEPFLRLGQQSIDWTIGYAILAALTAACGVFLWLSPRNTEGGDKTEAEGLRKSAEQSSQVRPSNKRDRRRDKKTPAPITTAEVSTSHILTGEVTWTRVLRWVILAFVPSSLMLGATTYITTDIASIPLLWVAPLALYLLSFILVFSRIPASVHKGMVLAMPLLVLMLLFFMLSELKTKDHWIAYSLGMHLVTLFVVSMVCHGELANDRPAAKYLTGYFLWMSVGGVLGGLFNGLLAPVIFTGIVEYELAMMLACFLAPPLGATVESVWGKRFDLGMAGLFAGVGVLLILLRIRDHNLPYNLLAAGPWPWELAALVAGVVVGITAAVRAREKPLDHWMDLVLPICLGMLLVGLSWGLASKKVLPRLNKVAEISHLHPGKLHHIFTYGIPIVMCYTFVERSLRFALGVGAILLASACCGVLDEHVLHQERSFFGVLRVENEDVSIGGEEYKFRRLVHGTTLHGMQHVDKDGKQFLDEERRDEPLTYYHRSGPIGQVMDVYNRDAHRNLAVIGLGTGTMACYARPGQHLTFYDIDPVVRRLAYDEDHPYFTFVNDARERGVHLDLVMGDARLTMERQQLAESEKYGLIVVDAFSSDAIPIHLITLQALDVYLDKMTEDGLLAFHISNRYLDLRPVLANLAKERGLTAIYLNDERENEDRPIFPGKFNSIWVVLARKNEYLDGLRQLNNRDDERKEVRKELLPLMVWPDNGMGLTTHAALLQTALGHEVFKRPAMWTELEPDLRKVGVWTDDYSDLLSIFSW